MDAAVAPVTTAVKQSAAFRRGPNPQLPSKHAIEKVDQLISVKPSRAPLSGNQASLLPTRSGEAHLTTLLAQKAIGWQDGSESNLISLAYLASKTRLPDRFSVWAYKALLWKLMAIDERKLLALLIQPATGERTSAL